jgi:hypothetical protein
MVVNSTHFIVRNANARDSVSVNPDVVLDKVQPFFFQILDVVAKALPFNFPLSRAFFQHPNKPLIFPLISTNGRVDLVKLSLQFLQLPALNDRCIRSKGIDTQTILLITLSGLVVRFEHGLGQRRQ